MMPPATVYTVGHSNHSIKAFVSLLNGAGITAVADVRSVPFSRFTPQFNRGELKASLAAEGMAYSFLGRELGARPADPSCYRDGVAVHDLIAQSTLFREGLERVLNGAARFQITLMCAEKDPLDCHRTLLVARHLAQRGARIRHILADGRIEEHAATERRLLKLTGEETRDLFAPAGGDPLERAYAKRSAQVAYSEPADDDKGSVAS